LSGERPRLRKSGGCWPEAWHEKGESMKMFWMTLRTAVGLALAVGLGAEAGAAGTETNTLVRRALPRLVDLGAQKCIPCKMMMPVLEDLKTNYTGQLTVEFIDVWKDPDAGKPFKINLIPTQIFYDAQGKEMFRHEGFYAKKDILAKWKELGIELKSEAARGQPPAAKSEVQRQKGK